jgi:signal-transduction protein with cAMP-binding, CBS, and nucleotidyltransferase domain
MALKVREIMTSHPVSLPADASLIEAAQKMRDNDIGDVLIVEPDGRLSGIVTDRDMVVRGIANEKEARNTSIGDVASPDLIAVDADDDADRAVQMMRQRAIRRVPVMDDGQLVGMISIGDMAIEKDPQSALAQISAARENL